MLKIKKGDLKPDLHFYDVRDQDGEIIDLSALAVSEIHVVARYKDTFLFDREVTGTADGTATMEWQEGDTDTVGRLKVELKIVFLSGAELTIPSSGYFNVEVTQDLDEEEVPA